MSDYLWWYYEIERKGNELAKAAATVERYAFRSKPVAQLTHSLCLTLGLDAHTRLLALEIFDHFLPQHLQKARSQCATTHHDWESIWVNIRQQIPLRILSCLQIASKLNENRIRLRPEKIRSLLDNDQENYR